MLNSESIMSLDWDWDCDCVGDFSEDLWKSVGPPPFFDVPPPPLPPTLAGSSEASTICYPTRDHPADSCQAFLVKEGGFVAAEGGPPVAVIAISAAILTAVIIIAALLIWRYNSQRKDRPKDRYQKASSASPASVSNAEDAALYDELLSYAPNIRASPPSYEMKAKQRDATDVTDVATCRCSTHPLLNNSFHYVASPYQQPQRDWNNTENLYEELPSGPEDNCFHNCPQSNQLDAHIYMPDGVSYAESPELYLPPQCWYRTQAVRGQLTINGPVRRGEGGVPAAWRELPPHGPAAEPPRGNVTLYRGKCPPEPPPLCDGGSEESESFIDTSNTDSSNTRSTVPRYYYYSENDDYGVCGSGLYRQRSLNERQQRHLPRNQRTTSFSQSRRTARK